MKDLLKNILGWSTKRKLLVIAADDYGNIRVASSASRAYLMKKGLNMDQNRFDVYDHLETAEDLEALFDVLRRHRDSQGRPAVVTPYALAANIHFDKVMEEGNDTYHYELLPDTLDKDSLHTGTWAIWQQGIREGLFIPQYHGREHLHVPLFEYWLQQKHTPFLHCLEARSYAGLSPSPWEGVGYATAFGFITSSQLHQVNEVALDGLKQFEKVFGYQATCFTPPSMVSSEETFHQLESEGIKTVETSFIIKVPVGPAQTKTRIRITGQRSGKSQKFLTRNVVFEPCGQSLENSLAEALKGIRAAFALGKPAVVSTHRVNFCGMLDEKNRAQGLHALDRLLGIVHKTWPEVEFVSSSDISKLLHEPS
jgi:hypothetical protein